MVTQLIEKITIEELFARSLSLGKITHAECYFLEEALRHGKLSEEHQDIITRILYCVRRGSLKIVH